MNYPCFRVKKIQSYEKVFEDGLYYNIGELPVRKEGPACLEAHTKRLVNETCMLLASVIDLEGV